MTTLRWVAAVVALTVLALSAGCVQLPTPVDAVEPPQPAMTIAQATAVRAATTKVVEAAVAKKDTKPLAAALAGPDLRAVEGDLDLHRRFKSERPDYGWRAGTVVEVVAPPTGPYPRVALVVTKLAKPEDGKDRMLEVYTRAGSTKSWLRTASVRVASKQLPDLAGQGGIAASVPATVNGYDTTDNVDLVAALRNPKSAAGKKFDQNDIFVDPDRAVRDERKNLGKEFRVEGVYAEATTGFAFATAQGGALVLTAVPFALTSEAPAGYYIYWTKDSTPYRVYKGRYRLTGQSYVLQYALHVPARGKIVPIGLSVWLVDYFVD